MKIEETNIAGLFLIEALRFEDLRGELIKPFNFDQYSKIDVNLDFKETWFTKSKKDVIRAIPIFQSYPKGLMAGSIDLPIIPI